MRNLYLAATLGAALALGACGTLPSNLPPTTYEQTVIDADAAYIAAAMLLDALENTGRMSAADRAKGEQYRAQAYNALKAVRATADAGKQPDLFSLLAATGALTTFVKGL